MKLSKCVTFGPIQCVNAKYLSEYTTLDVSLVKYKIGCRDASRFWELFNMCPMGPMVVEKKGPTPQIEAHIENYVKVTQTIAAGPFGVFSPVINAHLWRLCDELNRQEMQLQLKRKWLLFKKYRSYWLNILCAYTKHIFAYARYELSMIKSVSRMTVHRWQTSPPDDNTRRTIL